MVLLPSNVHKNFNSISIINSVIEYVSLDHKSSHKSLFFYIDIYA